MTVTAMPLRVPEVEATPCVPHASSHASEGSQLLPGASANDQKEFLPPLTTDDESARKLVPRRSWRATLVLIAVAFTTCAAFTVKEHVLRVFSDTSTMLLSGGSCPGPGASAGAGAPVETTGAQCQHGLFTDRPDGSILSINLIIAHGRLTYLESDPREEEYVSCEVITNYQQPDEQHWVNAECRFKGSTGSFMGCVDPITGQASQQKRECRKLSWKVKISKAHLKGDPSVEAKKELKQKKMNLMGMMHDDSLLRNHLAYNILREVGVVAPCSIPVNMYVNQQYDGLSDMTEQIDDYFTERRFKDGFLGADDYNGEGTLYKEVWFKGASASDYENLEEIEGLAKNSLEEEGDGGTYTWLFAEFVQEATKCFDKRDACSKEEATAILEKYTDVDSWINGFLGMTITANSDQITILKHNFYFYIREDAGQAKFFYLSWDFNQVLYDLTASPIPGYSQPAPWYETIPDDKRKFYCPYDVPSSDSDLMQRNFMHFSCDAVGYIMGVAWKDKFLEKIRALDKDGLVKKMTDFRDNYNQRIAGSISCEAQNGGWPDSVERQVEASMPLISIDTDMSSRRMQSSMFLTYQRLNPAGDARPQTMGFENVLSFWQDIANSNGNVDEWPSPTFISFGNYVASCMFDGFLVLTYLGQAGLSITGSVRDCPQGKKGDMFCTEDISGVIASLSYTASFLSGLVNECPITDSMGFAQRGTGTLGISTDQTACADQVTRTIGAVSNIAASAGGMGEYCKPGKAKADLGYGGRRLDNMRFEETRQTQEASCSFDVLGSTFYLARAGTVIDRAITACGSFDLLDISFDSDAKCSTEVNAILEAFSYAGDFLTGCVAQCAEEINYPLDEAFKAACAGDIQLLVGALSGIAEGGSGMSDSCTNAATGKMTPARRLKKKLQTSPFANLTQAEYLSEMNEAHEAWDDLANKGDRRKLRAWVAKHAHRFDELP